MTDRDPADAAEPSQLVVPCADLDAAIAFYTERLGFRLDMIMPADRPRIALVSGHGIALRLVVAENGAPIALRLVGDPAQLGGYTLIAPDGMRIELVDRNAPIAIPRGRQEFLISRASADNAWALGRAGMQYRDLIPGRLGGRFIASHIRIPGGGPVPDYVHYHRVRFQMIYCRRGWVRVVYEDQGPPFVMHAADCVLQPPTIRHRVLESSPGLEVIEIGCPAEHETLRDHAIDLPTLELRPHRVFDGQRFVRHVAADAVWQRTKDGRFEVRDSGISQATDGLAGVRVLRIMSPTGPDGPDITACLHDGEFLFLAVLDGRLQLRSKALGTHTLETDDVCVIPTGADYVIEGIAPCEVLEVALPAR